MMDGKAIHDFNAYLRNCTDKQVYGVYEKEHAAGRDEYTRLAVAELERRQLPLPEGAGS